MAVTHILHYRTLMTNTLPSTTILEPLARFETSPENIRDLCKPYFNYFSIILDLVGEFLENCEILWDNSVT